MRALFIASCVLGTATVVQAGDIHLQVRWDGDGQFRHELQVPHRSAVKSCEKLPAGGKLMWHFDASAPVNFNVHFHEGKALQIPVRRDQRTSDDGVFEAKAERAYCWMWRNKSGGPVKLSMQLSRQ
ncbi:MAG: hypothetical protein ACOZJZ_00255 [Pseudomonadota bacterium]